MTRVDFETALARIEAGDAWAWDELLGSLRDHMLRLLRRRGCAHDVAEDLVQEALACVWRRWRDVRNPARFASWATSIVLNQYRSVRSGRDMEPLSADVAMSPSDPARELVRAETRSWLASRIDGFARPEVREAVRLRLIEALGPAAAAQEMGVSRGRVRRWLHVGVTKLRETSRAEAKSWAAALGVAG